MLEQLLNVRPLVGIFNKALLQEVVKLFGPSGWMIQSWGIRLLYFKKNSHGRHFMKGWLHLSELDECDTQAPHINLIENICRSAGQSASQYDIL